MDYEGDLLLAGAACGRLLGHCAGLCLQAGWWPKLLPGGSVSVTQMRVRGVLYMIHTIQIDVYGLYLFLSLSNIIWVLPDLTVLSLAGFRNSNWGELAFGSQNYTPDETSGVNNALICYKEAVQFGASFVMSLFASFWRSLTSGNEFCIFYPCITN